MDRLDLLKNLSDEDLFEVICQTGSECKHRIISLLQENNITAFEFVNKDIRPLMTVFDVVDCIKKDINVYAVGYTVCKEGVDVFLIDDNMVMWWGDDACVSDQLWDVYKQLKVALNVNL